VAGLAALAAAAVTGAGQGSPHVGQNGSRILRDADVAVEQPGTHDGGGMTTGYLFFEDVKDMPFFFRKRALHPGSAIGLHTQEQDEVYYVLSGSGEYTLDGKRVMVGPGTAMLTRKGSSHALRQAGKDDLVIVIAYLREPEK
jgi:oxalate decarboxylase/phosphoglucose isomerase-like protein (cupin superfamily)